MSRTIAFLRGMNIGGHRVEMAELRKLFQGMGCKAVETFIASGNVIFETREEKDLEARFEAGLEKALGYPVKVFLRSTAELAAIAARRPFPEAFAASAPTLVVHFHQTPLPASAAKALKAYETAQDAFDVHGREVYWLCQTNQSASAFFKVGLEKVLKLPCTARSITTLQKLLAKYPD